MSISIQKEALQRKLFGWLPDLRLSSRFSDASLSFLRVAVQMGEPSTVQRALDRVIQLDDFIEKATLIGLSSADVDLFDLQMEKAEAEADAIRAVLLVSPEMEQADAEKLDRAKAMSGLDYADIYGVEPAWEPVGAVSQAQAFRQGKWLSRPAELDREFSRIEDLHESSLFDSASVHESHADRTQRLRKEQYPESLEELLNFM